MADVDIIRALRQFNRHWEDGEVSELIRRSPHKRRSFSHVRKRIENLPFEVIAGPRQVGKTTLMGHIMADLLASGVPRERVAYIPVDNPTLVLEMDGHLAPVIQAYERFVIQEELSRATDKVFLFIDEIQSLPDWGAELKGLHDMYHPKLRVLATGSSSAALLNAPTADFPGRVHRSHMHPLKFGEALENALPETAELNDEARATRALLGETLPNTRNALAAQFKKLYIEASPHEPDIKRVLDVYLVRGGYPATQPPISETDALRFFENALDTILSKDLKLYEKVRKPGAFRAFLAKLAKEHGGKFVSGTYGKDLGLDKETPAMWKAIAEELFLVHQLPQLNDSLNVIPGKADKAYIQDAGIRAYLSASPRIEDLEQSGFIGNIVEGVLFDHMRRVQFNTINHRNGRIGYWEKPEVDFLVELPRIWLAIECKYGNDASRGSARLRNTFASSGAPAGGPEDKPRRNAAAKNDRVIRIVATRNTFNVDSDIWSIPLWLLLLIA